MEVHYVVKGEPGKTCEECVLFKKKDNGMGDCYGHEVLPGGSCDMFKKKE